MVSHPELHHYAQSNEPLPHHLCVPLQDFLRRLLNQQSACQEQKKRVIDVIEDRRFRIQALEKEVESLSRVEDNLGRTLAALEAKKIQYASTVAPLRRVPPEVVAKIIQCAVLDHLGFAGKEERLAFIQIRSTCRLWRRTAFSTPSLWRGIDLQLDKLLDKHSADHTMDMVQKWLLPWFTRAGEGAALKLGLVGAPSTFASAILNLISRYGLNVTSLSFASKDSGRSFGKASSLEVLQHRLVHPLPVQKLAIALTHRDGQPQRSINLNLNFRNLTHFTLLATKRNTPAQLPVSLYHSSLSHLHLVLVNIAIQDIGEMLMGLPRLKVLALEQCGSSNTDVSLPLYVHQSLEVLELEGGVPPSLLLGLVAPSLHSLLVTGKSRENKSFYLSMGTWFSTFLERCGGPITFSITGTYPPQVLQCILSNTNTLVALEISSFSLLMPEKTEEDTFSFMTLPPSIRSISCFEQGTEEKFLRWMSTIRASEGQNFELRAPNCARKVHTVSSCQTKSNDEHEDQVL
ncbi:hypothetical protein BKA70DRAFT_1279111 [Coprinopsis sp. MPI-PUGE-AT-0042]|nr:hypothetical protein BKA70DRAFT_1279111 [Coprinopsis sp. MPI-PUGE-AT-0042]